MRACAIRQIGTPSLMIVTVLLSAWTALQPMLSLQGQAADPSAQPDLQIEVTPKGLGKEVSIRKGNKEWFMLIEVTVDNTVVVRQEKENDTYLVDESETHDRALTKAEVDIAIEDFINSVKSKVARTRR